MLDHWRFESSDGTEVPLVVSSPHEWAGLVPVVSAAPHSHAPILFQFSSGTDPGPALTEPAIQLRLRTRPWAAAPWGDAVPVTIVDGPP